VAAGTLAAASTDAVNGGQLLTANQRVAQAFGGGAGLDFNGQLTAPSYTIQGTVYSDVGSAFNAVDTKLSMISGFSTYYRSNTTGPAAQATGTNALAMGSNAQGSGADAVAIGTNAQATQSGAIAIGMNAASTGANAIAIGSNALATGSVAVGNMATAANGGAAFGDFAVATGGTANVSSATALGNSASATTANAVAVGQSATVLAANGAAFGANAVVQASATNSVAIGQGSVASAPNTVSVGAPGGERRITNVAPGIASSDAATVGQLSSLSAGFQSQIGGLQSQINNNDNRLRDGVALAMAAGGVPAVPPGRSRRVRQRRHLRRARGGWRGVDRRAA
jgi:autotransporter adhesin